MAPIPDIPPPSQQLHLSKAPDAPTHLGLTRNVCVAQQQNIRTVPTLVHLLKTLPLKQLTSPTATNREYGLHAIITTPHFLFFLYRSLNHSAPMQTMVKLLIIVPWQEMIGRLCGTPDGATGASRRANLGRPRDVSIMENGSRAGVDSGVHV